MVVGSSRPVKLLKFCFSKAFGDVPTPWTTKAVGYGAFSICLRIGKRVIIFGKIQAGCVARKATRAPNTELLLLFAQAGVHTRALNPREECCKAAKERTSPFHMARLVFLTDAPVPDADEVESLTAARQAALSGSEPSDSIRVGSSNKHVP
jgi:hypothetical protein